MFDYVPEKDLAKENSAIHENFIKKPIIHMPVYKTPEIFYKISTKTKNPTDDDIKAFAESLKEVFSDGFQFQDIAQIMHITYDQFVQPFILSAEDKRKAVLDVLFFLIDVTDTPILPDYFFDPFFKTICISFVNLIIPDEAIDSTEKVSGFPSYQEICTFVEEIKKNFDDGFQFEDLAIVTKQTFLFVNKYIDPTNQKKATLAKSIIKDIIENTDTPLLPDEITDKIFIDLANGFIDHLVEKYS
ncbi:MAG: hypothetical protein JXA94_06885 [Parachlamydiales bacterium]|nr:hypothetical protein [Parachlamydiales bacterium]